MPSCDTTLFVAVDTLQSPRTPGPFKGLRQVFAKCLVPAPRSCESAVAEYGATPFYGTTAIASMEISRPRGSLTIGDERAGGLVGKYSP